MKNNFQKFQKAPLIFSLILFLVSSFGFVVLYQNTQNNNQIFEVAELEWRTETFKKNEIASLERLLQAVEGERAMLSTHFIQSSDVVPFLDTIEKLAIRVNAEAEVTLIDISPENTSLMVGVRATGTFANLYKFLTLLENSPYQIEFTLMDLRRGEEEWSAIFTIKLLSFIK
ncbi:MAG: hypothetical protein WD963_01880 [Candidatus Paceibacterota bacterium]